jgi:hypothetical protein
MIDIITEVEPSHSSEDHDRTWSSRIEYVDIVGDERRYPCRDDDNMHGKVPFVEVESAPKLDRHTSMMTMLKERQASNFSFFTLHKVGGKQINLQKCFYNLARYGNDPWFEICPDHLGPPL